MTFTVTTIPDTNAGWAAIEPAWLALDATRPVRVPFTDPAWCRLWWRHYRRDGFRARDDLRLFAVQDGVGTLVGIAPMMLTRRPGRLPFCTRELQFLGADTNVTELRGVLAAPGMERDVAVALAAFFAQTGGWDWVQWHGLPPDGPAPPGVMRAGTVVDHLLTVAPTWEAFRAQLPRNIKESLRKCYNSLARDGHGWTVHALEGAEAVNGTNRLIELHGQRARRVDTIAHLDVFADPRARAFLADTIAATLHARLFALEIGGQFVAMRLGFVYPGELYLYYSGYDPAWSRYSVMTTLVSEAIKWAIGQGLGRVNLSTGSDVSKLRWRPDAVATRSGTQLGRSMRGRVLFPATQALRRAVRPSRSSPGLLG